MADGKKISELTESASIEDAHFFPVSDGTDTKKVAYSTIKNDLIDYSDDMAKVISPTITASEIDGGHKLTIEDFNGTSTVNVMDGATGPRGPQGIPGPQGETGTVEDLTPEQIQQLASYVVDDACIRAFETVADMQAAIDLQAGMVCHTNGFHASGDGGAAYYTVSASGTANGIDVLALQGGLVATLVLIDDCVSLAQLGAHGDSSTDDAEIINYAFGNYKDVCGTRNASYLIGSTIYISTTNSFDGNGCTFYASGNFASETRTNQPSLIALFVQGDGELPEHKSIANFTLRESSDVSGLIGMYVGAAEAYSSQVSTNGIAVLTRRFENITIVGFETGLFVSEAWDCSFDTIMVRASRTACCDIKGQSVNNRFDNCGFYGYKVSTYALRFAFNDYYSLRSEGNTFTGCFIGEATTGVYVSHTLGDSFIGCIIDLNSGHAIHDAGGAEMTYTNCYIYSTLVDASVVNGGTIFLAALATADSTIKSSFIGCNILNSGSGANSVIIYGNRLSDSFINCYIDKPIRAVQTPTKTIVIGCTFAGSGSSAIYAYSASRYVALGNVDASDGSKLFDNGFSDFVIKSGTATATTGSGGEISFKHDAGLTFYVMYATITSNVAHHMTSTNNGRNYAYCVVYGTNGSTVPNTEVTFNYVIIGY